MPRNALLALDAVLNLLVGVVLLAFPAAIVAALGIPEAASAFYPSVLGAVLAGIGIALLVERWRPGQGLALGGAVAINLSVGAALAVWLVAGDLALPARGYLVLWSLCAIAIFISLFELRSVRRPRGPA